MKKYPIAIKCSVDKTEHELEKDEIAADAVIVAFVYKDIGNNQDGMNIQSSSGSAEPLNDNDIFNMWVNLGVILSFSKNIDIRKRFLCSSVMESAIEFNNAPKMVHNDPVMGIEGKNVY